MAIIGLYISIWKDIIGGGGIPIPPSLELIDRAGNEILDRFGANIQTRV